MRRSCILEMLTVIALGGRSPTFLLAAKLRMRERNVGDPYHPYFFVGAVPHPARTSNLVLPLRQPLSADHSAAERTPKLMRPTGVVPSIKWTLVKPPPFLFH